MITCVISVLIKNVNANVNSLNKISMERKKEIFYFVSNVVVLKINGEKYGKICIHKEKKRSSC